MSMDTLRFSPIRSVFVAVAVLAGLAVPAEAAPIAGVSRAAMQSTTSGTDAVQIHSRRYGGRYYGRYPGRRYNCYNYGRCGRYGYWNDGWRYRNYRPYRRHYPGVYLGLGVAPYAYYAQPRRYYRGAGSAHVRWCYDRYRSYRAWDNTFQPYHGGRRQCWSPYS
jgi:hypothetical protein